MTLAIFWTTLILTYLIYLILQSKGLVHKMKITNPFAKPAPPPEVITPIPPPPAASMRAVITQMAAQRAAQHNAHMQMIASMSPQQISAMQAMNTRYSMGHLQNQMAPGLNSVFSSIYGAGGGGSANAYIGQAGPIRPGEWGEVRLGTAKELGEWIFQTSIRMPTPLLFPQHVAKQLQIEGHVARMLDFINEPFGYHSSPDHYLVEVVDCLKKQTQI